MLAQYSTTICRPVFMYGLDKYPTVIYTCMNHENECGIQTPPVVSIVS